jgi:PLP dependent protein
MSLGSRHPVESLAQRLASVRARMRRALDQAGRSADSVRLIAVSKQQPEEAIREAYALGQREFGESYAQELSVKCDLLADLSDIEWHFVGHLQTNKAKIAAKLASMVHTVDSTALARQLGLRAQKDRTTRLPVLIEVNVAAEPQKAGASPSEIEEVMAAVDAQPSLHLRGLMTLPPADLQAARRVFETLVTLRNLHGGSRRLPELSMGMSNDLELAIGCGATLVRVGTAIFGER